MGLATRGTAAVVRPCRSNAVPNPTPNPPPEGALPLGAAGEHWRVEAASKWCDLGAPPLRPRAPGCGPRLPGGGGTGLRRGKERLYQSRLLPEPAHASSHSEPLFPHP